MDNGWDASADAWIADQGNDGDFGRQFVLDPIMLSRTTAKRPRRVLDVGCGEGRFCRALSDRGIQAVGIDPTSALIHTARRRDPGGPYFQARAEALPFDSKTFDLVVSYLTLIDIPDLPTAISEMSRVLAPGGALLIATLTPFVTACADTGWVHDADGQRLHYPVDNYLDERGMWVEWRGIRIVNYHRPMTSYMKALLGTGLRLVYFDEPSPTEDTPRGQTHSYRRAPWFMVMEWIK